MSFSDWARQLAAWLGEKTEGPENNTPSQKKIASFFEQYPLSALLPYDHYDSKTQIFYNKKSLGFILEAAPLTSANEQTVQILSSILTDMLPVNADLQCLLWASPKIGEAIDAFAYHRSQTGDIFQWLAQKRADFLKQGASPAVSSSSALLRDFRLYLIVSIPCKKHEGAIGTLQQIREDIVSSLKSIQLAHQSMDIHEFIGWMRDLFNPSDACYRNKTQWQPLESLPLQLTDPEYHLQVHSNQLLLQSEAESYSVRCLTVKDFPPTMMPGQMTDSIGQLFNTALQIPCPFLISFHIRPLDQEKSIAMSQMHAMNKESTARSHMAKFRPNIQQESQDWAFVRDRLSKGDKLVKVFYQVLLYSPLEQANSNERKVLDLYRANGWKLRKSSFLQLQSWLAMCPMMMSEGMFEDLHHMGRLRTLNAFAATNLLPLQGEYKGTRQLGLLLPGRRGQIANWNPFDNPEGNYNVAIAAKSGSGKSVLTQEYIVSLLGSGGQVWVIDVGRSYEKTCHLLGGEWIEFKKETPISLNPFTCIEHFDESLELLKPLVATMARPHGNITDEEIAYVEKALKAAWIEKGNRASMDTVVDWLDAQSDSLCQKLAHLLYTYTEQGMYGRYFQGKCTLNFNNPLVVLELEELKSKKDLQKIVLLVLMYQIAQSMFLGNRTQPKSCVIDEAWDLLDGDNMAAAKFIETGYRRARRYNANFVTITQSINDYFKNPTAIAAYENSDFNVILNQKAEAIDQLKASKRLDLDPYTEKLIKDLKKTEDYSECVIKSPQGISLHRILLDPYSRILYSSKGEEFEAVKRLQAQGYTLQEAIAQVADSKYPTKELLYR